jgi:ELWxxDGT repeat protein
LGATLVFFASDGVSGGELWTSDGTFAGTQLVKDIHPGSGSGVVLGYQPFPVRRELARVGGTLFFPANDGTHGEELWRTDGTAAGTQLVKDVAPGSTNGPIQNLCAAAEGTVFFRANPAFKGELWKTDGTESGTLKVSDAAPSFFSHCVGNRVFFDFPASGSDYELWTSDGTEAGTFLVKDIRPGLEGALYFSFGVGVASVGDQLLFWADDGSHGFEPWVSDGTPDGTLLLADLAAGSFWSAASSGLFTLPFSRPGEALFFAFATGHGWEPWRTDGTPGGTQLLADTNQQLSSQRKIFGQWVPLGLVDHLGELGFAPDDGQHGSELWRSDGSELGTALVKDIYPGEPSGTFLGPSLPQSLIGKLILSSTDPTAGNEPWVSDLTSAGTQPLADTEPGELSGSPWQFIRNHGRVYFGSANRLWVTDGTPAGTQPLTATFNNVSDLAGVGSHVAFVSRFRGPASRRTPTCGAAMAHRLGPSRSGPFPGSPSACWWKPTTSASSRLGTRAPAASSGAPTSLRRARSP